MKKRGTRIQSFLFNKKIVNSKCSQANIIVVVLIILLVLAAIVIVWNVVRESVEKTSGQIDIEKFNINLDIKSVKLRSNGGVDIEVHRGAGKGKLEEIKVIIEDANEQTHIRTITEDLPDELETKTYPIVDFSENVEVKEVSVRSGVSGVESKKDFDETIKPLTGLVSWWKFDNDFNDSVGGNDGSCTNCPDIIDDSVRGKVVNFDGIDDVIFVADKPELQFVNGTWSFWAWINSPQVNNNFNRILTKDVGTITSGWTISLRDINANTITFALSRKIPTGCVNLPPNSPGDCECYGWCHSGDFGISDYNNKWSHFVFTVEGNIIRFYVDGEFVNSEDSIYGMIPSDDILSIGSASTGTAYNFDGSLDNIMIFNRSLTVDGIQAIYNNQLKSLREYL